MKILKTQLKKIIKEELGGILNEGFTGRVGGDIDSDLRRGIDARDTATTRRNPAWEREKKQLAQWKQKRDNLDARYRAVLKRDPRIGELLDKIEKHYYDHDFSYNEALLEEYKKMFAEEEEELQYYALAMATPVH